MDVGNRNNWNMDQVVPAAEIIDRIHTVLPLEPLDPNYTGEVAKRYRYLDGGGEIGLIASVTQPFCGDCTRARLSTDGKLYTCSLRLRGNRPARCPATRARPTPTSATRSSRHGTTARIATPKSALNTPLQRAKSKCIKSGGKGSVIRR